MAKSEGRLYYSIRVIKANSRKQAIKKTEDNDFEEFDSLCDIVLTKKDLEKELSKRKK